MKLSEFDYYLPERLIAQLPCEPRDHSKLLCVQRSDDEFSHQRFYQMIDHLRPNDILVFNDTKVLPARLYGIKQDTGAKIEILLLKRLNGNDWECLAKPGKKLRHGAVVSFSDELQGEIIAHTEFGGRIIRFCYEGIFEEIIERIGHMPLPPYIHERLEDKNRYQTVYAKHSGAAAAPTAGLHFTPELLRRIDEKGVQRAFVTLHVGLGTFRPVEVEDVLEHTMHSEFYSIPQETVDAIARAKANGGRVIAVGTTAIRTLETAGASGKIVAGSGWTDIFIYPGYQFRVVEGMVTNFHLPKSTLLLLISAFAGKEKIMRAYEEAIQSEYRFFSFGDAMLIL
ncbi:tRNA preQ1(34) S-adenosylmethionine ribosyltransferase-isomerase QueA [Azotosporobacter soli]|uniref:tRNA preQ1(34) S-adenosylmethionine ribosyltransferase-isomerase QueA n=1 Tax=Azotosporobacter soli TaxID=3055040 RepID=UPI0031FED67A